MSPLTQIGLFEGYGGLTHAVQAVTGGELVAYSEIEPAACRLLEHHHPNVPNLGDVTQIDWSTAPQGDVLTGGFPCQDVSAAGRRAGMRPGTRSGLWTHMAYAIDQIRPDLVVIENVRGLLSADAACDLESCPWCLGDNEGRPLRALGAVLGTLADLGYDAQWCGLRAADVGAPHSRFRVFITAWPAAGDTALCGRHGGSVAGGRGRREVPPRGPGLAAADGGALAAADPDGFGSVRGGAARGRRAGPANHGLTDADAAGPGRGERPDPLKEDRARSAGVGPTEPRGRDSAAADADSGRRGPHQLDDAARQPDIAWGDYEPAVRRWELILGRPAPAPTQTGKRGGQQLSPLFVEWLMGLPEGHVSGVPGLSRNEQLKLLGNGVVPQQAEAALRHMLVSRPVEVAA